MSSNPPDSNTSSTISSTHNNTVESNYHVSKWEKDLVGDFLINLYYRSFFATIDDWCISKDILHEEFALYSNTEQIKQLKSTSRITTTDIETLMHNCGYLIDTPDTISSYKINHQSLFEYRNKKILDLDNLQICSNVPVKTKIFGKVVKHQIDRNNKEKAQQIDTNYHLQKPLEYQGSRTQPLNERFVPNNLCCFICQVQYGTIDLLEKHVQLHGSYPKFQYLNNFNTNKPQNFTLSYAMCDSNNFCFEMKTSVKDVLIEKIIIVLPRSFYYVNNTRVPYKHPENSVDRFFVDSNLFTMDFKQPIIIISRLEHEPDFRTIEQHNFMCSEEFPKSTISVNPNRLPNNKLFEQVFDLPQFHPPKEIRKALKQTFYQQSLMACSNDFRDYIRDGKRLKPQTMADYLKILLQIEDTDRIEQYAKLRQNHIKLNKLENVYSFQLKAKQRVFLERMLSPYDDLILVRSNTFTSDKELMQLMYHNNYEIDHLFKNSFVGLVQAINTGRISFKCNKPIDINCLYSIVFRPSRVNIRNQYRALALLSVNILHLKQFLFPEKPVPRPLSNISLSLYNSNINEEQLQAVRNIFEGPRNDATYIIYGPPGTGKTTTLVESILQLLRRPNTKILVTASSNTACDEIALRLCKFLSHLDIPRCLARIYSRAYQSHAERIDDELLENSNLYDGHFTPDIEILHRYRIVVCTLSVTAKLATGQFGRDCDGGGVYTHLFIDEIAASLETEALLAITSVLTPQSSLIVSGDHKQLGPILNSMRAEELGFNVTLLDRLLQRDCYRVNADTGEYDRTIQTRLIRNYRSHPAIVNLYSAMYYNNSLLVCAKKENVSMGENWHKLPNKQYPILFHASFGVSRTDPASYSCYNFTEIGIVMHYVKDLMYFGINGVPVKETDIGIISPYQKQYKLIKEELELRKWFDINIGSVEKFQGQEKQIIIVSFVRSGTEELGFLDSPRRLNVTLSRAKSLLIIIGNPKCLSANEDFNYVIDQCKQNNTYINTIL